MAPFTGRREMQEVQIDHGLARLNRINQEYVVSSASGSAPKSASKFRIERREIAHRPAESARASSKEEKAQSFPAGMSRQPNSCNRPHWPRKRLR